LRKRNFVNAGGPVDSTDDFSPPEAFLEKLRLCRAPLIIAHIYPDGDALGSAVAMHHGLTALGATPRTLLTHRPPETVGFIDPDGVAEVLDGEPDAGHQDAFRAADTVIVLDTSEKERLGRLLPLIDTTALEVIGIDHHLGGDAAFFDELWCVPGSPSTGNLVLRALEALEVEITDRIALPLFVAVATDTGWFRFSNSSQEAYSCASKLVARGVDPEAVHRAIFESASPARTRLLGRLLADLRSEEGGKIVFGISRMADRVLFDVEMEEMDGFVDALGQVGEAEIVFLVVELSPGRYKVSLRSKGQISIHPVAARFGGGGHAKAAGCRLEGSEEEILESLVEATREQLAASDPSS